MKMKSQKLVFLAIPIAFLFICCIAGKHYSGDRDKILIQVILDGLRQLHFLPVEVDDTFSQKAYKLYLERLDYSKRFFVKEDIGKLESFKLKLDDEATAGSYEFYVLANALMSNRLTITENYVKELTNTPFDFSKKEEIETDEKKIDFAKNEKDLKERWRLYLKFQTLDKYLNLKEEQAKKQKENKADFKAKTDAELEAEARKKTQEDNLKFFKRMAKVKPEDKLEMYINCLVGVYDPHTNYYAPEDKKAFDINMSGKLEGIGAQLKEEDGYIKVTHIVPGSPSWKQGELKDKDIILKVAQGNAEPVSVVNMPLDEVVKQVRGAKGTEVRLTVKKTDGTEKIIIIIRDVVIMEEGNAKSTIIEDKTTKKKIGFIHLPSFYADFQDRNGRKCSEDVKNELIRLKGENVDGIVLDLRYNGGGSLNDVVDMAGYFIEKGPIVQVKNRDARPYVMYDHDKNVIWDGPFVVLVNSSSASASEILAAAMQDYGRAVIVGSTSTFGKGTVQRFVDLDEAIADRPDLKPLGSVKLTIQKFYRINGGSTQLKGVTPDVIIPDAYNYIEVGEREEDYPMPWSEIPASNFTSNLKIKNLEAIKANSKKRVESNEIFQKIDEQARWYKKQRDETKYNLQKDQYVKNKEDNKAKSKMYENIYKPNENFDIYLPKTTQDNIATDTSKVARMKEWQKNIKKDPQIQEAVNIIQDLLKQ
jgi:carboxyl-terminal processing protease